ncbi:hypothetical protein Btru_027302 [Bulinus truncatus]|nr:hypothetical protein Btru_027302 [Bulinus truncatus]
MLATSLVSASTLPFIDEPETPLAEPDQVVELLWSRNADQYSQPIIVGSVRPEVFNEAEAVEVASEDNHLPTTVGLLTSTFLSPTTVTENVFSPTSTLIRPTMPQDYLRRWKEKNRREDVKRKILEGVSIRASPTFSAEQRKLALDQIHDQFPFFPRAPTPEQRNCFLATCSAPKATNEDIWNNASQPGLRLNFNLPRLDRKHENDEVRTARLNLFIKPRKDCPCVDEDDKEMSDYLVTIYQFIRPLSARKRTRVVNKHKILNAIMVPAQGNAWITLDIKRAVTTWMKKIRKNFGVEVTVQDSYGQLIDAKEIFVLPDCSSTATERSCRDGHGGTIAVMPWTEAKIRDDVVNQNLPYVDVVITDKTLEKSLLDRSRMRPRNVYV